jgi:hypothetical protein
MPESTYARVDFIPQSGTLDLASGLCVVTLTVEFLHNCNKFSQISIFSVLTWEVVVSSVSNPDPELNGLAHADPGQNCPH